MLWVVREVRCVFSQCLKVSNMLDSLIAACNSLQTVGAEKLKERLLKLVVQLFFAWLKVGNMFVTSAFRSHLRCSVSDQILCISLFLC